MQIDASGGAHGPHALFGNQRRIASEFLARLRPHIATDRSLPARIEGLLKSDRRLGSRDRRLYRELIYTYLRFLPWLDPEFGAVEAASRRFALPPGNDVKMEALAWLAADTPATRPFRKNVLGASVHPWPPCPDSVSERQTLLALVYARAGVAPPGSLAPEWCAAECPLALEPAEYDALHRRAPLWLRVRDPEDVAPVLQELAAQSLDASPSEILPGAVRVSGEADVTRTDLFHSGRIEVQDLGSQLILAAAAPAAGETWLDACAGAGGKSLQLATLLGQRGRIYVNDIRPAALAELETRARRAALSDRIRRLPSGGPAAQAPYDGVLVDAPCSGTGTWRRSPHLKWSTTPALIAAAAALQASLLASFSAHVRPGGRLVYATCSLCPRENGLQVAAFLAAQPHYRLEFERIFRPSEHDGDGFFVASLRRAE